MSDFLTIVRAVYSGLSQRKVAATRGVSRNTVSLYLGSFLFCTKQERDGQLVAGNSAREVRQSLLGLKRRDEKQFIRKAVAGAGLRLSIHERSVPDNGEIVSSILYRGWSDDGEEVVSGACLGEILESLEKWQENTQA